MSILSVNFLIFISILLICYYCLPKRLQWIVLLVGSYGFYAAAGPKSLVFILFTTITTFVGARRISGLNQEIKALKKTIEDKEERKLAKERLTVKKKQLTALILIVNFCILFIFKAPAVVSSFGLILPLGISFYTFQSIGYLIDVYRGEVEASESFFRYALFTGYFPQIIQGPVNRYGKLQDSLYKEHNFDIDRLKMGFLLFLWGAFKKLVIAERTAIFVRTVLGSDLTATPGSIIFLGICIFNLQLYTDFSGGIDMVMGISEMFGIEMAENFRRPFFSLSLGEYWRRWHISLGQWIKDYVFYPLAISKRASRLAGWGAQHMGAAGRNLPGAVISVITFVLIGLWHEISLRYLFYGLWHGGIMGLSVLLLPQLKSFVEHFKINTSCMSYRWFLRIRTWMLITIGEYFSMAPGTNELLIMFKRTAAEFHPEALVTRLWDYSLEPVDWNVIIAATFLLICVSMKQEAGLEIRRSLLRQNLVFRLFVITFAILTILIFGVYTTGYQASSFIYGGF